jgi:hypothetical protein
MKRTAILVALGALLVTALGGSGCSSTLSPRVRDGIAAQVEAQRRGLERCYQFALKANRKTRGRVTLNFTVSDETGRFGDVRLAQSEVEDPKLVRCLARRVARLSSYPRPERPVRVTYAVDFSPLEPRETIPSGVDGDGFE